MDQNLTKKNKKINPNCDKNDTKIDNLVMNQSKIGLTFRTIKILKWNEYQSEYMRQKPHRKNKIEIEKDEKVEEDELQNSGPEVITQVTDRGKERKGEEMKRDERREKPPNEEPLNSPLPLRKKSFY